MHLIIPNISNPISTLGNKMLAYFCIQNPQQALIDRFEMSSNWVIDVGRIKNINI